MKISSLKSFSESKVIEFKNLLDKLPADEIFDMKGACDYLKTNAVTLRSYINSLTNNTQLIQTHAIIRMWGSKKAIMGLRKTKKSLCRL